jgi:hypothetical protein
MVLLRRRSLFFKLLLLIPAVWFCALLLFASTNTSNSDQKQQQQRVTATRDERRIVNEIQGFGPPIIVKEPSTIKDDQRQRDEIDNAANIPRPKQFVVDPNLPIYKKGDPNQAGELGKGVTINKNVSTRYILPTVVVSVFCHACSRVSSHSLFICPSSVEREYAGN